MASKAEPGASILRKTESDRDPLLTPKNPRRVSYGVNTTVSVSSSSGGDSDETSSSTSSNSSLTCHQWKTLVVILSATLSSSFAVCLFPPFFPRLAEEKGCNAATYGFIIGTNCLTSFLVTPYIAKNLMLFGISKSMIGGLFIGGICCALSGFLAFFPPGAEFVVVSIVIRAVHATGNAFVITATFSYAALAFDKSVGTVFSMTRIAMNSAQMLGPVVGGAIYQAGGFYLPFVTMGALQALMGLICLFFLPRESVSSVDGRAAKKISILKVLKIPTIWFSFMGFIVATVCNGFLSINLEPQVLRQFDLKPFYVGILFGMKDGANALSTPLWGYFCDKSRDSSVKHYLVISALLVALSFVLMGAGAVVMVDIRQSLPLVVVALCLNGAGIGGEQVAGVVDALNEAVNAGYPDDPAMHGLIAGLWSSLSGLGRFVSRLGSGILVDFIGFNPTAAIVTVLQVTIAAFTFLYLVFCECTLKVRHKDQAQVSDIDDDSIPDEVVFHDDDDEERADEGVQEKSTSIDVPSNGSRRRICSSLPSGATSAASSLTSSSFHYSLSHSFFNET